MRLLLDTNIVIMIIDDDPRLPRALRKPLHDPSVALSVSAISLWEIAIKTPSGKLTMAVSPQALAGRLGSFRVALLPLKAAHAVLDPALPIELKDPFDRMFVAVAECEQMQFLTTDSKLLDHPLAWRP